MIKITKENFVCTNKIIFLAKKEKTKENHIHINRSLIRLKNIFLKINYYEAELISDQRLSHRPIMLHMATRLYTGD